MDQSECRAMESASQDVQRVGKANRCEVQQKWFVPLNFVLYSTKAATSAITVEILAAVNSECLFQANLASWLVTYGHILNGAFSYGYART